MDSLQASDAAAAAVAVAPRVTLANIEGAIAHTFHFTGHQAAVLTQPVGREVPRELEVLTVCLMVLKNGFTVVGKSAPASPENFDAELGRKFAYDDGVRQLWPLMGFALRDRLARDAH